MARVRPGVELVLAILAPRRELITLDLPTFERPRKATSGVAGGGKCSTAVADVMNLDKTRTTQFPGSSGNLQVRVKSVQAERTFIVDFFVVDWAVFISQLKD